MNGLVDEIIMQLPKKADYVSLVRLTASGIASRTGFDIDAIEDIKVAISEVCNKIISHRPENYDEHYNITFRLLPNEFKVLFKVTDKLARTMFEGEDGEFAKLIISSLMDEFTVRCDGGCIITMGKSLGDCPNE